MREALQRLSEVLTETRRVLVSTHINPDGDAVGSVLGLRRVLRTRGLEVEVVMSDPVPPKYRSLVDDPILTPDGSVTAGGRFDLAVFVDASEKERVGLVWERLIDWLEPGALLVNIDHHIGNDGYGDIVVLDPVRASAGELVLEIADEIGAPIDEITANQLFAAVLTDTGRFQFSNTNEGCLRAAGRLVAAGANPQMLADRIYYERPAAYYRLLGHLFERMEIHADGRICLFKVTSDEAAAFFGEEGYDSEGIVDYTVQIDGVDIGAFLRQTGPSRFRSSLRSRGRVNVRPIAEAFGGGGHEKAAGCALEGTLEDVRDRLVAQMTRGLD